MTLELTSFQSFLFLLGSFFVPLFAVLLADWLLARAARYDADDVFGAPSWRAGMLVGLARRLCARTSGSRPTGPTWWVDQVQRLDPPAWGIGATLPSFVASFVVGLVAAAASRRRSALLTAGSCGRSCAASHDV